MRDRVTVWLTASLALLVIGGAVFARPHHPVFVWHDLPGHMAAIGLVGCLVVVKLSKWIGKLGLQRPETQDESGEADER